MGNAVPVGILWDGVVLAICGMGVVFTFLFIMIWMMNLMRIVLAPFANALTPAAQPVKKAAPKDDMALIAAAVAAVEMERK